MQETKIVLPDREIPKQWYNIMADMPNLPKPPLHPGTKQPVGPQDLSAIFPMALIEQVEAMHGGMEGEMPGETPAPRCP